MDSMKPSFEGSPEAWIQFTRAYTLQMRGQLDAAIVAYKESIRFRPTAEAHTFLGWTYSFQGKVELAIECCKEAIATDPDFGNPYNDIGAYLLQLGRPGEAIDWLVKAVHAPRYEAKHFPWANLGSAYESLGETARAIKCYKRALNLELSHEFSRDRLFILLGEQN